MPGASERQPALKRHAWMSSNSGVSRPTTNAPGFGDEQVRGDVPAETRFRVRASCAWRHGFVTACVRKQSRLRATTGPRS
jgi:hypothetical protein